eukprot:14706223-Alexandrium_andersonii.AAC.1
MLGRRSAKGAPRAGRFRDWALARRWPRTARTCASGDRGVELADSRCRGLGPRPSPCSWADSMSAL